ncbi:Uncharacterised protein [Bordetella pertussis]|nr:Uncharacterised protein [Bordetella pertussis]
MAASGWRRSSRSRVATPIWLSSTWSCVMA